MYIVGDSFTDYCDSANALKISDFMAGEQSVENYQLGQGLTFDEFNKISFRECVKDKMLEKVALKQNHKHKEKNSLIVNFRRDGELQFSAGMYIHGDNDLLMDHVTGLHIPGVALIEASRELFIVALSAIGLGHYRFVLTSLHADFMSYVFPVNTRLSIQLECLKDAKQEKIFVAHIHILQGNKECTGCTIKATVLTEALAKFSEKLSAKATTEIMF